VRPLALRQDRRLDPVPPFPSCRRCRPHAVVGPTGAGKSVLLALMALQFRRYEGSQVFAFDFGGIDPRRALAMGGDWHDLGGALTEGGDSAAVCPAAACPDRRTPANAPGPPTGSRRS
jgi:hypothetical protein